MKKKHFQVVVIGAGPAGMAAAITAAKAGLKTIVIDDQRSIGGQVYRSIQANSDTPPQYLGNSYYAGTKLSEDFACSGASYLPDCTVWQITETHEIALVYSGKAELITAEYIVIS